MTGRAQAATGSLRGRPRGRLRATIDPWTKSSPPQTPHGSSRSSALARHSARTGHAPQRVLASSTSAGRSANQSSALYSRHGMSEPEPLDCSFRSMSAVICISRHLLGVVSPGQGACPRVCHHVDPWHYPCWRGSGSLDFSSSGWWFLRWRPPGQHKGRGSRMSGSAAWRWPGLGQLDRWSPGAEVRNILDSRRLERRGVERTANANSEAAVGSLQGREADAGDLRRVRHRDVLHQGQPPHLFSRLPSTVTWTGWAGRWFRLEPVSYTHLRAHETVLDL